MRHTTKMTSKVHIRRAQAADVQHIGDLLQRLSDRSRYQRYCHQLPGSATWASAEARRVTLRPDSEGLTLIAMAHKRGVREAVGVAELVWAPGALAGEIALLVRDDHQGRGVGTALARRIVALARARGIAELHADMLPENRVARHLLRHISDHSHTSFDGGLIHLTLPLAGAPGGGRPLQAWAKQLRRGFPKGKAR